MRMIFKPVTMHIKSLKWMLGIEAISYQIQWLELDTKIKITMGYIGADFENRSNLLMLMAIAEAVTTALIIKVVIMLVVSNAVRPRL